MNNRYVNIWFRYLKTDWFTLRRPALKEVPFVLSAPDHGRMVITAANALARGQGIDVGSVVADARAVIGNLEVMDEVEGLDERLLLKLAEWFIRYSPVVAVDLPDGLILDATGCAHLWGGEENYLREIINRMKSLGYTVRASMADTIGAAWAMSRFNSRSSIIEVDEQLKSLLPLPPMALRLEPEQVDRLHRLGLRRIRDFIGMPSGVLRRRFGDSMIVRLNQALGTEMEFIQPVLPPVEWQERLPCIEPISTRTGIDIALERLLENLCSRLMKEEKGLRSAIFRCYRVDGKIEQIEIGTNRATCNTRHLFKLFEQKIDTIEPDLGIELFVLDAPKVEEISSAQQEIWNAARGVEDIGLAELLDKFAGKFGAAHIKRYLPDEHYWPERSMKPAPSLNEKVEVEWRTDRPRPLQLLAQPERIDVTAPIPDYPPMNFRYRNVLHVIVKADGPERIEQEWWLQQGDHRDYYYVEDEQGKRYWLFRLGHYDEQRKPLWFVHGFFA